MGIFLSLLMPATYWLPKLYFPAAPATLAVQAAPASKEASRVSLRTFVETRCPTLFTPFHPAWWLPSGHFQTAYCVVGDFSKVDRVEYDRTLLRTVDGGTIGIDSTPPENERKLPDDTTIVVVLHGLTGGSHESYVRAVLAPVCTPVEQGGLGYRGIVVNFRGCAGVPLTSPQLYSAGYTDDIRVAVMHIRNRYPRARLIGLGFSLGANVLVRYLSEEGEHSRLVAGCILACPWDLLANNEQLVNKWFHRNVYARSMGQNLLNVLKRHAHIATSFPDSALGRVLPRAFTLSRPVLEEFDDTITRLAGGAAPPFPFPSARAYYVWASSHTALGGVRVPLLALNAEDDPVVQVAPVETENPRVVQAMTRGGGHLGWFEARRGRAHRWVSRPVVEWLRAVGEDLVVDAEGKTRALRVVDGFVKEEGRDDIGCKVVEGGGHIVGVEGEGGLLAGL